MTDDDPIAGIRAELLRLRRDFEAHRSMPPATNGATLDQVVRELLNAKKPLQWRREPPDVPGWYWYCDLQRYGRRVRIEHWDERKIKELGRMGLDPHPHRPRWAGPIAEPEEMRA